MSMFNLNTSGKLQAFLPKRGRGDDAVVSCELQIRGAVCLPSAAAAAALADDHDEFTRSIFKTKAEDPNQTLRFFGFKQLPCDMDFDAKHMVTFPTYDKKPIRVALISKIVLLPHPGASCFVNFSIFIEDPDPELVEYLLGNINDTVKFVLEQSEDLIDKMRSEKQGMAPTVHTPENGQLDLSERDKDQLAQAANGLSKTAEVPLKKSGKRKAPPAKKAAGKRAAKSKAA